MKIYNYDEAGVFVGESVADESPLEVGVFLIPALATEVEPPKPVKGKRAVWNGSAWELQDEPVPFEQTPEYAAMMAENEARAAKRAEILTALASAAGLSVDDVKSALGA